MSTCDDTRDAAAELVLGILDGAERAEVVDHLAQCAACRSEVARMTEAVDGLNLLAPTMAPSAGFQRRVIASIDAAPTTPQPVPQQSTPSRALRLLTAAAVLLVGIISTSALLGPGDQRAEAVAAPMIGSSGERVGDAYLFGNAPAFVVVAVSYGGSYGGSSAGYSPTLQALDATGAVVTLGALWWGDGQWRWRGEVERVDAEFVAFRVIGSAGEIFCEGHLDR